SAALGSLVPLESSLVNDLEGLTKLGSRWNFHSPPRSSGADSPTIFFAFLIAVSPKPIALRCRSRSATAITSMPRDSISRLISSAASSALDGLLLACLCCSSHVAISAWIVCHTSYEYTSHDGDPSQ